MTLHEIFQAFADHPPGSPDRVRAIEEFEAYLRRGVVRRILKDAGKVFTTQDVEAIEDHLRRKTAYRPHFEYRGRAQGLIKKIVINRYADLAKRDTRRKARELKAAERQAAIEAERRRAAHLVSSVRDHLVLLLAREQAPTKKRVRGALERSLDGRSDAELLVLHSYLAAEELKQPRLQALAKQRLEQDRSRGRDWINEALQTLVSMKTITQDEAIEFAVRARVRSFLRKLGVLPPVRKAPRRRPHGESGTGPNAAEPRDET